jgi:hypothetical protein
MTVHNRKSLVNDSQPLSRQISRAASRLDQRKMIASALASSLRSRIRSGFTSPRGLMIAGFSGFLAGEWVNRPRAGARQAVNKQRSKAPGSSHKTLMPKAVLLTRLVLDLKTRWTKASAGVRQRTDDGRSQAHAFNQPGSFMDNRENH